MTLEVEIEGSKQPKWVAKMVSIWWLLVAFVGGGYAGIFLMALMRMSADLPE